MNPRVRKTATCLAIAGLTTLCTGCPGAIPSIIGEWSFRFGDFDIGVQLNANGTVVGTGSASFGANSSWEEFGSTGVIVRNRTGDNRTVQIFTGIRNADGTIDGTVCNIVVDSLFLTMWTATKL